MPRTIISEHKKDTLFDIADQLEDALIKLSSALEDNADIKDDDYDTYENNHIAALYGVINLLRNEVIEC